MVCAIMCTVQLTHIENDVCLDVLQLTHAENDVCYDIFKLKEVKKDVCHEILHLAINMYSTVYTNYNVYFFSSVA